MTGPRQLFVNSIAHLKVGVKNFRELIFLFGGKTQSAQEVTDPRQLFINSIEYPKLGVKNFRGLVFLCGGKIDEAAGKPQSARDVYYRYVKNNDTELFDDVVIADFIMEWNENGIYRDLISFEKSLASLSGAIVVFVESYGSVAELGSFVMIPELTKKLIVVPQGRHFNVETAKQGFVVRGPILFIKNASDENTKQGIEAENDDEPIIVLDWDSNDLSTLDEFEKDVETFHVDMIGQIKRSRVNQKFDSKNEKHRMLLIIDLVQQMMALEFNELKAYLKHFGIDDVGSQRLRELLFLLEKLHYIRAYRFLKHDYYVPGRRTNDFIVYHFVDGTSKIVTDSLRRMNAVSEFYELRDRRRFRALKALERGRANG